VSRSRSLRPPERLLFELGGPGKGGWSLPPLPDSADAQPEAESALLRDEPPPLPEVS